MERNVKPSLFMNVSAIEDRFMIVGGAGFVRFERGKGITAHVE